MAETKKRKRKFALAYSALAAIWLCVAALSASAVNSSVKEETAAKEKLTNQAKTYAKLISLHDRALLAMAEVLIKNLMEDMNDDLFNGNPSDDKRVQFEAKLTSQRDKLPGIASFSIVGADGIRRFGVAGKNFTDLSNRSYFKELKKGKSNTYVSPAEDGLASGKDGIHVAVRSNDSADAFRGLAVINLSVNDFFRPFYSDLGLEEGTRVQLASGSRLLFAYEQNKEGKVISLDPFPVVTSSKALAGTIVSDRSGGKWIYATEKLPGTDIFAEALISEDKALDAVRETRRQKLAAIAIGWLLAGVATYLLLWNLAMEGKLRSQAESWADLLGNEVGIAIKDLVERERETVIRLSKAAERRDPETGAHILRMASYSQLIAKAMGLESEEQILIFESAPLHDIGKVGIPDGILLKNGKLTDEEFKTMKTHSDIGFQILDGSSSKVLLAGAEIARAHHEKYDGSGYPLGIKGHEIPLRGRIVAVADVFDALMSVRPYKKAWKFEDAVEFIKNSSGTHFDPKCVEAFLASLDDVKKIIEEHKDESENTN